MTTITSKSVHPMLRIMAAAAGLLTSAAFGQAPKATQGATKQPPSISEKTSEAFGKLRPLQEAQNYKGMLDVLEKVEFKPNSYDEALILDMKAKIFAIDRKSVV